MVALALNRIGQIALPVRDVEASEAFYEKILGLRKLYRFGNLAFFDCAGVRLMLEQVAAGSEPGRSGCIYFRCADIGEATRELAARGLEFISPPHLVAAMPDHDLWMAFFTDPDGHMLALMHEAPKGYAPAA
jgi:methylmalonyl-CoA/ethylmalonyl-CoA epimerase